MHRHYEQLRETWRNHRVTPHTDSRLSGSMPQCLRLPFKICLCWQHALKASLPHISSTTILQHPVGIWLRQYLRDSQIFTRLILRLIWLWMVGRSRLWRGWQVLQRRSGVNIRGIMLRVMSLVF
ncbi:hypothetical protein EV702DRAFT_1265538 [Suillus placidus]|uniref:Uncharacterized protein n=1 Tax=Suillus placidus TaxID=48579 RepID=A0A9P7A4Z5_9AGAM|nr:hypothetical protein EV702DRAFT_1265538 [Suillus placidus]